MSITSPAFWLSCFAFLSMASLSAPDVHAQVFSSPANCGCAPSYQPQNVSYAPTVTYYAPTVTYYAPTVTYYAPPVTSCDQRDLMKCLAPATLPSVGIPVVGDPCVYGIEYNNSKRNRIEYSKFKRICQEGIANKTMPPVELRVWIEGNKVGTNISNVMDLPGGQKLHPITVLRITQVNIESLRVFANEEERRRVFWSPRLEAAERVVAEALGRVQDGRLNASERQRTAVEANEKVTQIFAEALESYAKRTKRQVQPIVEGRPSVTFNVETNPSGLTVELLLVGDYILLSALDPEASIDESPLWVSLPSKSARAYGVYYYRFRKYGKIVSPSFSPYRKMHITNSQDSFLFE